MPLIDLARDNTLEDAGGSLKSPVEIDPLSNVLHVEIPYTIRGLSYVNGTQSIQLLRHWHKIG